jgi:transcriptional regulator with XRE-family HTH domain
MERYRIMEKSTLAAWLRHRVEQSGQSEIQFATAIGVNPKTLNYILNHPDHVPSLAVLGQIAAGTGTPIDELVAMLGFPTGRPAPGASAEEEQIARLLAKIPRLREWIDTLSQMDSRELDALEAYVDGMRQRRRRR